MRFTTPDWALQLIWFCGGIGGTGGIWYFLSQKNYPGIISTGFFTVVVVLLAVALHVRNDILRRQSAAGRASPVGTAVEKPSPDAPGLEPSKIEASSLNSDHLEGNRPELSGSIWTFAMNQYTIWRDKSGLEESVKIGWSWPAFFFPFPWAVVKRMTLPAICVLILGLSIGTALAIADIGDDGFDSASFVSSLIISMFFGANGNAWRARRLTKRGFDPVRTTVAVQPFLGQIVLAIRAVWLNSLWRAVAIATILIATVGVSAHILLRPSLGDLASEPRLVEHCDRAVIEGSVYGVEVEAFVWFEWGETPELGNVTAKQRFTEDADYYQHLIGLRENTIYYYTAIAIMSDSTGVFKGRVRSFRTPPCKP